jgi:hypothetical protein
MRRIILMCLCLLIGLVAVGCGPKISEEEQNAPAAPGPRGGYQPPPPGATGARSSVPMGSSMPAGANPNMGR